MGIIKCHSRLEAVRYSLNGYKNAQNKGNKETHVSYEKNLPHLLLYEG